MKLNKHLIFFICSIIFCFITFAAISQEINSVKSVSGEVEMADQLRSSGKIYVVVAVLTIIFSGIIFFLFRIENKILKIEKNIQIKK